MASSGICRPWSWHELTAHVDGAEISSQLGPPHVPTPWKQAGSRLAEAYGAMSPRGEGWCGQIGQFFILPENEHPKNVDLTGNTGKQQQQSLRSLIIMTGSIAIRYCWYYYYAQTATPAAAAAATPSWNCKDHIQVICGFHDVSQALFSSGTCTVDGTCPCPKKDPSFQHDCQTMEYDDTPGVR